MRVVVIRLPPPPPPWDHLSSFLPVCWCVPYSESSLLTAGNTSVVKPFSRNRAPIFGRLAQGIQVDTKVARIAKNSASHQHMMQDVLHNMRGKENPAGITTLSLSVRDVRVHVRVPNVVGQGTFALLLVTLLSQRTISSHANSSKSEFSHCKVRR